MYYSYIHAHTCTHNVHWLRIYINVEMRIALQKARNVNISLVELQDTDMDILS